MENEVVDTVAVHVADSGNTPVGAEAIRLELIPCTVLDVTKIAGFDRLDEKICLSVAVEVAESKQSGVIVQVRNGLILFDCDSFINAGNHPCADIVVHRIIEIDVIIRLRRIGHSCSEDFPVTGKRAQVAPCRLVVLNQPCTCKSGIMTQDDITDVVIVEVLLCRGTGFDYEVPGCAGNRIACRIECFKGVFIGTDLEAFQRKADLIRRELVNFTADRELIACNRDIVRRSIPVDRNVSVFDNSIKACAENRIGDVGNQLIHTL